MDARLYEWMVPTIYRLEPWCDETLIAAGQFHAVGGRAPEPRTGILGALRGLVSRASASLPEDVFFAVGQTKVFVFAHRIGEDLSPVIEAPVRVWRRDEVVARGDTTGTPIRLTIDVTSTGEHHELESAYTTGMPGKVSKEIVRLLDDPAIGSSTLTRSDSPPREATSTTDRRRARLLEIADELEAELKRMRWWMPNPPSEETVLGGGAFGMNAVPFPTWIQVVLVKRLRQAAAGEFEIPRSSSVSTFAIREFDGYQEDTSGLMDLLHEVDHLAEA